MRVLDRVLVWLGFSLNGLYSNEAWNKIAEGNFIGYFLCIRSFKRRRAVNLNGGEALIGYLGPPLG